MKRLLSISVVALLFLASMYSESGGVTVEINNVAIRSGDVYMAVYNSEKSYKAKEPFATEIINAGGMTARTVLSLPDGEYVFSVFQDMNGNGKLDTNFLGMPKEPVGISNYNGKGIPGGFNTLKIPVSGNTGTVSVDLVKL